MENKLELIIGKQGIRNLFPGMSLKAVEKQEGPPDSDETGFPPYYEYEKELEEGEELTIYYSYDQESKKVSQIEFFFYFYPSAHDDSDDLFKDIKDQIIEKYTEEAGEPKMEAYDSDNEEESYLFWDLKHKKTIHELVFVAYKDDNDDDPYNARSVIKIVLNEKQ